jgi:hypothetical protein
MRRPRPSGSGLLRSSVADCSGPWGPSQGRNYTGVSQHVGVIMRRDMHMSSPGLSTGDVQWRERLLAVTRPVALGKQWSITDSNKNPEVYRARSNLRSNLTVWIGESQESPLACNEHALWGSIIGREPVTCAVGTAEGFGIIFRRVAAAAVSDLCATSAEGEVWDGVGRISLVRCCVGDEGFVAPRSRPAGEDFKPP